MAYQVDVLCNKKSLRIDEYVARKATIYHMTDWLVMINRVFHHNGYCLYVTDSSGAVCGVLPLIHINSRLFGSYFVSMPYFNYGGIVGDTKEIESILFARAINLARELNVHHMELRESAEREGIHQYRSDKVNMVLDLPSELGMLDKSLGSKLRAQVKRSMREGIETSIGRMELLNDFYKVFSENMRDLGTPVYSKLFFKTMLETFESNTKIIVLRLSGTPVSAAFLIGNHDQLEIPWASTIRRYNKYSPNMLLYWTVLQYAIESGYKKFDFGRSTVDSGTYKFKQQWGAAPVQQYWNYWLSEGSTMPKLNPDNHKYKLAISIWKRLPLVITNLIGPSIVKNLP